LSSSNFHTWKHRYGKANEHNGKIPRDYWGTFYFFNSVLGGYSRSFVYWEICEKMEERDVEQVIQRALDKHPEEKPLV